MDTIVVPHVPVESTHTSVKATIDEMFVPFAPAAVAAAQLVNPGADWSMRAFTYAPLFTQPPSVPATFVRPPAVIRADVAESVTPPVFAV